MHRELPVFITREPPLATTASSRCLCCAHFFLVGAPANNAGCSGEFEVLCKTFGTLAIYIALLFFWPAGTSPRVSASPDAELLPGGVTLSCGFCGRASCLAARQQLDERRGDHCWLASCLATLRVVPHPVWAVHPGSGPGRGAWTSRNIVNIAVRAGSLF